MIDSIDPRRLVRLARRLRRGEATRRERDLLLAFSVSLLAGAVVFVIATGVFPYHSINDDEAVYLLQAAMLLEGQLGLHAGDLAEAVRPWFFVADGDRLYPKYNPVPAAMFAVSMALVGEPRVTLALVAAGNAALVYVLGSMVFDRRVGVVAATVFAASPMALLTSSAFLPYAPTTFLNLLFAACYLRGVRDRHVPSAAAAGIAVGLAFFSRPYTAVLFAAPFVAHALWSIAGCLRRERLGAFGRPLPDPIARNALTAAGGLAFVGLTLAYNLRVTGSPLVFPYEAFAPLDGPGFGYREIEAHAMEYTPEVALEANGYVLWYLATRWIAAGPLGALAALAGLALAARRWIGGAADARGRTAGVLLAATLLSVAVGNLAFWGNRNVLATMDDPNDGLLSLFGPFYHFDALAALSVFAGFAVVAAWRSVRSGRVHAAVTRRTSVPTARRFALVLALSCVLVTGGATAALVATPMEKHATHTSTFERAYEPFEEESIEDALVFLPTPYGDWLGHPFQSLRNDPGLDGEAVYALDGGPERDFAVLDAYPDRTPYRYVYHGSWSPTAGDDLTPALQPLSVREGEALDGETTVAVPARVDHATVRLDTDADEEAATTTYDVGDPGSELTVDWTVDSSEAELVGVDTGDGESTDPAGDGESERGDGAESEGGENVSLAVDDVDELDLSVTLVQADGSTLTYHQEVPVRSSDGGVEAVWPPERWVCTLADQCDEEDAYLPEEPELYLDGVAFENDLEAVDSRDE